MPHAESPPPLETGTSVLLLVSIICIVVLVIAVYHYRLPAPYAGRISQIVHNTNLTAISVDMRARDTEGVCDRLFEVKPFGWMIWAHAGRVYVLDNDAAVCPSHGTAAVILPFTADGTMISTCIGMTRGELIRMYESEPVTHIDVPTPDDRALTVLDIVNMLFVFHMTMRRPASSQSSDDGDDSDRVHTWSAQHLGRDGQQYNRLTRNHLMQHIHG